MDPLLGKFVLVEAVRTGVVEAPIGLGYFLIRFDGAGARPLAVIDIAEIAGDFGEDGDPPSWLFFDTADERSEYLAALAARPSGSSDPMVTQSDRQNSGPLRASS